MLVVVLVSVAVSAVRRRRRDDAHSVEGYRHTLHTLEGLRSLPPAVERRVGGTQADRHGGADAPGTPAAPVGPVRSRREVLREPARDRSIRAMDRPQRRLGAAAALAVLVVAVVAAVVVVGLRSDHHTPPRTASSSPPTTHARAHHSAPTTTLPASYTAESSTSTAATYRPASNAYSLQLGTTSGACWVSVTTAGGTTVFAATLTTGASKVLTVSGPATVVIGAPSVVAVSIDRVPVVLPTGFQAPFTMTLTPAAASTGTATTSGG